MLKVEFGGTPYEMGLNHGKKFSERIKASFDVHCNFAPDSQADSVVHSMCKNLDNTFPEALEEMRGIADGSGLPFMDVLKLNSWEEISDLDLNYKSGLCTSIAFMSAKEGPIMGKTTDIEREQKDDYILSWVSPEKGNNMLYLGKVGTLKVEVGLNEKGLCVGSSSSKPTDTGDGEIERMTLLRYTLQYCDTVDEAVEFMSRHRLYHLGLNILLLDKTGKSAVVEKGVKSQEVRYSDSGEVFATNFYACDGMKDQYDYDIWYYENSLKRYHTLEKIFEKSRQDYSTEWMKSILRSHEGEASICGHEIGLETCYASVINPVLLTMEVTDGRPCENEFVVYELRRPEVKD